MKWYNCKEGQPPKSGRYLVINAGAMSPNVEDPGEYMVVAYYEKDMNGLDPDGRWAEWQLTSEELGLLEGEPTHWLHLPSPPNDDLIDIERDNE